LIKDGVLGTESVDFRKDTTVEKGAALDEKAAAGVLGGDDRVEDLRWEIK
jgi:hypothetical protein